MNRIQSSRRLERENQRNVELMWLTQRLMSDFKTIADFRKENGVAIRAGGREFELMCRKLGLFAEAVVAIDGSKFKTVKNHDKNFTEAANERLEKAPDAMRVRRQTVEHAFDTLKAWMGATHFLHVLTYAAQESHAQARR